MSSLAQICELPVTMGRDSKVVVQVAVIAEFAAADTSDLAAGLDAVFDPGLELRCDGVGAAVF